MCTYKISIDDAVMEVIRPTIANGMDENTWVQIQVDMLFSRMAADQKNTSFDDDYMTNLISMSAPAWNDVKDADLWIHELRGE
jgi:hypothetical protein